jgi:Ran GTPase-activating protein (RanGAP) involved in mRNA processing and transport
MSISATQTTRKFDDGDVTEFDEDDGEDEDEDEDDECVEEVEDGIKTGDLVVKSS